jgi:hypothetical protein
VSKNRCYYCKGNEHNCHRVCITCLEKLEQKKEISIELIRKIVDERIGRVVQKFELIGIDLNKLRSELVSVSSFEYSKNS